MGINGGGAEEEGGREKGYGWNAQSTDSQPFISFTYLSFLFLLEKKQTSIALPLPRFINRKPNPGLLYSTQR